MNTILVDREKLKLQQPDKMFAFLHREKQRSKSVEELSDEAFKRIMLAVKRKNKA